MSNVDEVRIVNLVSNEWILCVLEPSEDSDTGTIVMLDPFVFVLHSGQAYRYGGPLIEYTEKELRDGVRVEVLKDHIITSNKPPKELAEQYLKQLGVPVIETPKEGIIVPN